MFRKNKDLKEKVKNLYSLDMGRDEHVGHYTGF
jgi:hypothetical protein